MAAVEHAYNNMSQWLLQQGYKHEAYKEAMKPLETIRNQMREEMQKKEADYQGFINNAKNVSQTFRTDEEQYLKDVQGDANKGRALLLSAEEIGSAITDIKYGTHGEIDFEGKNPQEYFINKVIKAAEDQYKKLKQQHGDDWDVFADKNNIKKTEEDFVNDLLQNVYVNLGEHGAIEGDIGDQHLKSSLIALPRITYKRQKDGSIVLYEGGKEANSIAGSIKDIVGSTASEKNRARRNALYSITKSYSRYRDAITKGGEYQRTHSFDNGEDSGYLKTLALADDAIEPLLEVAKFSKAYKDSNKDEKRKFEDNLAKVNAIMSTKDFKAQYNSLLHKGSKEDIDKIKKEIDELFEELVSKENRKGIKKNQYSEKVAAIADAFDINSENFAGSVLTSEFWHRHPTINFKNDLNNMVAVLSSNDKAFSPGNIYMNKELLAIDNGDADGDLIAMKKYLLEGDMDKAGEAFLRYQEHVRLAREKVSKQDSDKDAQIRQRLIKYFKNEGLDPDQLRYGDLGKITSVQDLTTKNMTIGAMFDAKKGAGIYGDLVYFLERLSGSQKDIDVNSPENGKIGIGANSMHAMAQSLYQRGINIKNAAKLAGQIRDELGRRLELIDENTKYIGR